MDLTKGRGHLRLIVCAEVRLDEHSRFAIEARDYARCGYGFDHLRVVASDGPGLVHESGGFYVRMRRRKPIDLKGLDKIMPSHIGKNLVDSVHVPGGDRITAPPIVHILPGQCGSNAALVDVARHGSRTADESEDRSYRALHADIVRQTDELCKRESFAETQGDRIVPFRHNDDMSGTDRKAEFGRRLRATRIAFNFKTGREFATALDLQEKALSGYETGRSVPDIFVIERMCDVLQVTSDWLLLGRTAGLPYGSLQILRKANAA